MATRKPQRTRRESRSGAVRQLPSRRWQAKWRDGDALRPAPVTFDTKLDAETWLRSHPDGPDPTTETVVRPTTTLKVHAEGWLEARDLKPRTRADYRRLLDAHVLPRLGHLALVDITVARVRTWYGELDPAKATTRSHAYLLLHAILATAVADDLLDTNPCRIRGAGSTRTRHRPKVASLDELDKITAAMPDRYRTMVLLAAWCGLRFGELTELRRSDVDLGSGVVRVSRGVVRVDGAFVVGDPKSQAGRRTISVPPHLIPTLTDHLDRHVGRQPGDLLFPARHGQHMAPSTLYKVWYPARTAAGRPDLRFHDLRHTGATLAAATGATLADLMARMGHSTSSAALIYQHAAQDRDKAIAEALSGFAAANVVPLRGRRRKAPA